MDRRQLALSLVVAVLLVILAVLLLQPTLLMGSPGEYGTATVTAVDADGTELATVDVRIANTSSQRYVGLSKTSDLPEGSGMLFVFDDEDTYTFVMRNMSFALDMLFVDANGTVTTIQHAPVPEATPEKDLRGYPGEGKYVLEVNRGWSNRTGVDVGDRIAIPAWVSAG